MNRKTLPLLIAISVIVILQAACGLQARRIQLDGDSMKPNLVKGDIITVAEVPLSELKRGDVILIEHDGNLLVKRLIGLPGETISIVDGKIYIDGTLFVEPYAVIPATYSVDELKLDSDSYFVLGDNRPDSLDSHQFGPIKGSAIKGKAIQ